MREIQPFAPVGIVRGADPLLLETRNALEVGDQIEYLGRTLEPVVCTVLAISGADGAVLQRANPGSLILLAVDPPLQGGVEANALFRKRSDQQAE